MPPIVLYLIKCAGALFGMFLLAGASGSLVLGERPPTPENINGAVTYVMLAALLAGFLLFWPKWPRRSN